MDAEVVVDRTPGHVTVRASGEFDVASTVTLGPPLQEACDAGCDVDLDLHGTTFCDVSFLRVILEAQARLKRAGHTLQVLNPPPVLLRMVTALRLDELQIA